MATLNVTNTFDQVIELLESVIHMTDDAKTHTYIRMAITRQHLLKKEGRK